MPKHPKHLLILAVLMVLALLLALPITMAQTIRPTPIPVTPGAAIYPITPTRNPNVCANALPLQIGEVIFIKEGVNLRNLPSLSGGIVWNTVYDNRDAVGRVRNETVNVAATILEGSVCADGYNWWRVGGLDAPGWVAEGRPESGYFIISPRIISLGSCTPIYPLSAGMTAELRANARVRESANTDSRVRTVAPAGATLEIVEGGQCVEGYRWWRVRVTVADFLYDGWMAEGEYGDYYLVPANLPNTADGTLCGAPLELAEGTRAYVNDKSNTPKALRTAPNENAPRIATMVNGVPMIIEAGPVCNGNLNWWRVRVLASTPIVGWMAEGSRGVGFWISTINPFEFAR